MTAGLGFKMAASNSKWRFSDVIVTSRHGTLCPIPGSETQKKPRQNRVKNMFLYPMGIEYAHGCSVVEWLSLRIRPQSFSQRRISYSKSA